MNLSLTKLSDQPKLAMAFGAILAAAAAAITCVQPWVRGSIPGRLSGALGLASTLLAFFGILYLFGGIQSWRKAQAVDDSFDKAKETARAGLVSILGAVLLFFIQMTACLGDLPKWLCDVLGEFSMGLLFVGALYLTAGFYARRK